MTTLLLLRADATAIPLAGCSVDAIVTDPPYGLEFMGKAWDKFRVDDPGTSRNRGERAGNHGQLVGAVDESLPSRPSGVLFDHAKRQARGVSYGGTNRPTTSRCLTCGKRDQRRNPHACGEAAEWVTEVINPHAAPPTMLAFQAWTEQWAREALRVLKPGGHLLAFGGTRTYHRLTSGLEDAGFEIRDSLRDWHDREAPAPAAWIYASGFPKGRDIGRSIDMHLCQLPGRHQMRALPPEDKRKPDDHVCPETTEGLAWAGWDVALKPSYEPIVLARKPLAGTVAATVLAYGTGGLNIDGCRVGRASGDRFEYGVDGDERGWANEVYGKLGPAAYEPHTAGRWPPNTLLSHAEGCEQVGTRRVKGDKGSTRGGGGSTYEGRRDGTLNRDIGQQIGYADPDGTESVPAWACQPGCPVAELDRQSGVLKPGGQVRHAPRVNRGGWSGPMPEKTSGVEYGDEGGASRFFPTFRYTAKAGTAERPVGDDGIGHPTVKPLELMRWLVRLITPPGGIVLDPFCGSGPTLEAALIEGFRSVGLDSDATAVHLTAKRLAKPIQPTLGFGAL